jgi:hypothetical protein
MSEMDVHGESDGADSPESADIDIEAPEADAVEQHTPVMVAEATDAEPIPDVDDADRYDQQVVVALDEDDYR